MTPEEQSWLKDVLFANLNFRFFGWERITGGLNSRVYLLKDESNNKLVSKFYVCDSEPRLEREFQGFRLLKSFGLNVPQALLMDKDFNCGVYSFVEGTIKDPKTIALSQLDSVTVALLQMQKISYDDHPNILPARNACDSFADYERVIYKKIRFFEKDLFEGKHSHTVVNYMQDRNPVSLIESKLNELRHRYGKDLYFKRYEKVLSPGDFGLHNIIFKNDRPVFIDFEYFGWDHRWLSVAQFINHDHHSEGLSKEQKEYFLASYIKTSNITKEETREVELAITLSAIEWVTVYLSALTEQRIKQRQHSNPMLNVEEYSRQQLRSVELSLSKWMFRRD